MRYKSKTIPYCFFKKGYNINLYLTPFFMFDFDFSFLGLAVENSGDLLNIALSISVLAITFFLCLVLVRLFRVLGTLDTLLQEVQDTIEIVQNYLWQPARLIMGLKDKLGTVTSLIRQFLKK